jgi:ketosteroid isomerase-like protein
MNTAEVGKRLVDLCREGKNTDAIEELYDRDILAIEAAPQPGSAVEAHGLPAIREKRKRFVEGTIVHSSDVQGPYPQGDRFAVHFKYDITPKQSGKRSQIDEVALYTVRGGKIVKEEFFYQT